MSFMKLFARQFSKGFTDSVAVSLRAGKGGDGCIYFKSVKYNPHAGAGGGDGGTGGHVVLQGSSQIRDLSHVPSVITAANGENGHPWDCHGKSAEHNVLSVPVGTDVYDHNGHLLWSFTEEANWYVAARGGAGGKGNAFFVKNEHRLPKIAEKGAVGEMRRVMLHMRVIADFGFVGCPNAGKSSLLRALTRAKPRVASYAFTTLAPNVGILMADEDYQVALADIPGLIEHSHLNRGLGHNFLHHITKCHGLAYVVDLGLADPFQQLTLLRAELEHFSNGLSDNVKIIVANKTDLTCASDNLDALTTALSSDTQFVGLPIFSVSAKSGYNLNHLRNYLINEFRFKEFS